MTYREFMEQSKRAYFLAIMEESRWKVDCAAAIAGLNRTQMYRTLKRLKIDRTRTWKRKEPPCEPLHC